MTSFSFNGDWSFPFHLQAFEEFRDASGAYSSLSDFGKSNGIVKIEILDDEGEYTNPLPEQIMAINYLITHQNDIAIALLEALAVEYSNLKSIYGEDETYLPNCITLEDYKKIFGIGGLFIHQEHKDGIAYIGFECGCIWDEEHGLGFMTHKNEVISIGSAEECMCSPDRPDTEIIYKEMTEPNFFIQIINKIFKNK
jgi:hypothetical protein